MTEDDPMSYDHRMATHPVVPVTVGDRVQLDYDPNYVDDPPRKIGTVSGTYGDFADLDDADFDFIPDGGTEADSWTVLASEQTDGKVKVTILLTGAELVGEHTGQWVSPSRERLGPT